MATELEQTTNALLLKMVESVGKTGDFLAGQLPEVIQQLLTWHMTFHLIWAFGFLIVFSIIMLLWIRDRRSDRFERRSEIWVDADYGFLIGSIGSLAVVIPNVCFAIKIWLAPKLYLLEYVANIIAK